MLVHRRNKRVVAARTQNRPPSHFAFSPTRWGRVSRIFRWLKWGYAKFSAIVLRRARSPPRRTIPDATHERILVGTIQDTAQLGLKIEEEFRPVGAAV
jgi:hypothetical protein